MKQLKGRAALLVLALMGAGMACRLSSPTPASWSATPSAQARAETNAAIVMTQNAAVGEEDLSTPTRAPLEDQEASTPEPIPADGPWLVYPAPEGAQLHAYDVEAGSIIAISLPEPIYTEDLTSGLSPDGHTLIIRAGSAANTDELGLYQVNLPEAEVNKISNLLSISLQRKIVNQEGTRAVETLEAVTRPDGLAWSPDGRYLAFTAALDNESSDLYVYDTLTQRVDRLNGLYSQNASPFWAPDSTRLISQELEYSGQSQRWRAVNVSSIRFPGYDDQNTVYVPISQSQGEVFLGWTNANRFLSYSQTAEGPFRIRQVNVKSLGMSIRFDGLFDTAAFDPGTQTLAFALNSSKAALKGLTAGIYLVEPESTVYRLQRAGDWAAINQVPGSMFVARGETGVLTFTPEGGGLFLPGEMNAKYSPQGNWMVAWGDGDRFEVGARLYQPTSDHGLQTLVEGAVETVSWQPDSKGLFIQSEGAIYHLAFPGLKPRVVESGFQSGMTLNMAWVE